MPNILIVGGTGKIGTELLSLLAKHHASIRVLRRPNSKSQFSNPGDFEIVYGDLDDSESIRVALKGISQVFLLTRDQPQQGELESKLIDLAISAGVKKIVKSSAFAAGLNPPVGYGLTHTVSEQKLMTSGLNWVILRPYMFMQNFLELADLIKSRGIIPLPMGKTKIGLIDARDVALVAKTILVGEEHENRIYELTGPESLSLAEAAEILSNLLGRTIHYRSPPLWLAGLMMRMQDVSSWDVRMRKQLFRMIHEGGEDKVTGDVEKISGQKPRTLEMFFREYQNTFQ
ncbi:MAG: SDR family oxidoreductase [Gammaproteobacteria bacterium]|nr:SDR family oxidoreductase [Gammaproteobacteria bacterium]